MSRRFAALRVIGTIFKVLAWIALLLGLFSAILVLIGALTLDSQIESVGLDLIGGPVAGISAFVIILIVAILNFLFFYGIGELFFLFLSIEESARRTAYFTQQMFTASQSSYPLPPPSPEFEDEG